MKTKSPTLLDFAILGLVRLEAMTGYRIRKAFEETEMGNYSSSPGTIYPALHRMLRMGLLEKVPDEETGKAVYRITHEGFSTLKKWLIKPIGFHEVEREREELFLRFAFMDVVDDNNVIIGFLESFRNLLSRHIADLNRFYKEEGQYLPLFGRLAFEQGISSAKATLHWCKKAIKEVQKNNN